MELTQDRLWNLLEYDQETGVFRNRIDRKGKSGRTAKAGDIPGSVAKGYLQITVDGRCYKAHRLAWLYVHGEFPKGQIDHIDGNRLNNRIANLRQCTQAQNNENIGKLGRKVSSAHVGVCYLSSRNRWIAHVRKGDKSMQRYCRTEQEAIAARAKIKAELHSFNPVDREVGQVAADSESAGRLLCGVQHDGYPEAA